MATYLLEILTPAVLLATLLQLTVLDIQLTVLDIRAFEVSPVTAILACAALTFLLAAANSLPSLTALIRLPLARRAAHTSPPPFPVPR